LWLVCRLCVEELRNAGVDALADDVTDTGTSNMSPGDNSNSLTADIDGDVGHVVSFKSCEDTDGTGTGKIDDDHSFSVHAPNSDSALTDNSVSTSVKTEDSTGSDCIAAEKYTETCSASAVKDEAQNSLTDMNDDEPVVLALNLTKNTSSNGNVSPQNVAKTFVIVENNDSGDDSLDAPIDLSRGPKPSPSVMVNGTEFETGGMVNGIGYHDDSIENVADISAIRRYQEELRNEETKLVLMKKIRHSQAVHRLVNDSIAKHSTSSSSSSVLMSQSLSGPPPLVRGGFQSSTTASHRTSVHQSSADMPRLHMQVGASGAHTQSAHHSTHGPPPLLMAPRQSSLVTSANRSTSSTTLSTHGQTSVHSYRPTPSSQPPVPEQTAAQRQAAAKLALRRQLEKTLLQIPPPKPPPPEMNFIPNINMNAEFVMLVGLEEAVKCIVDADAHTNAETVPSASDVKYVLSPFECVQCQTDFTPVWKRDRPGSKSVICERCVTTNQKRALKQEHTNRLKGAFVRALQQEQEIEQSLLAGAASCSSSPPPAQSQVTSSQLSTSVRTSAGSTSVKPATDSSRHYQGMSSYLSSPNLRSTPGTTGAVPGMSLPSAAAAAFTASRLMFPYQQGMVPSTTSRSSSSMDLPRQFLLDMIPRRAPVDGQVLWRT